MHAAEGDHHSTEERAAVRSSRRPGYAVAGSRRRDRTRLRWFVSGALVYLTILAVVVGSLFLLHHTARDRLDQALGERLAGVAVTASYLVDGDSLVVWTLEQKESLELLWLASRLEQIRLQNELAEIALCDPDERVIVSAAGRLARGERNIFWDLDRVAVQVAKEGFLSVSRLYRSGSVYQKSAHAPIFASNGRVAGVLTVEGNADFFDSLALLRRWAWFTGIVVLLFLGVMGWSLYRLHSAMERYRASIWRQENLAAMGRMTAGIAHEIRNPLSIIRGAAQHLTRRMQEVGIEDEVADYIPAEVDRLDRILKGYLAFGTDQEVQLESVDLIQPVRRTVRILEEEMAAAGIEVVIEEDMAPCRVLADRLRLQQVLLNLFLNARDAMPNGGKVTVWLGVEAGWTVLTVTDQGTGLKGLPQEKLFTPFWTDKEKGSGLGLVLARQLMENQNGTLTLKDRPDRQGAVAEIRLPNPS